MVGTEESLHAGPSDETEDHAKLQQAVSRELELGLPAAGTGTGLAQGRVPA